VQGVLEVQGALEALVQEALEALVQEALEALVQGLECQDNLNRIGMFSKGRCYNALQKGRHSHHKSSHHPTCSNST
jgi:hypothetical protein